MGLRFCWSDDYNDKADFYSQSTDDELVAIVRHGGLIEDVPVALWELRDRDLSLAIESAKYLLDNDKGDRILQASLAKFIAKHDRNYASDFLFGNLEVSEAYANLYGSL